MKKIFLVLALSLSLFVIQSCDNDKKETKDEKTLSTTDVPAPFKQLLVQNIPQQRM
jgi:hypothetical protein